MKERPILFSGPMVRAILDGRKTQTRRIVKPDKESAAFMHGAAEILEWRERNGEWYGLSGWNTVANCVCPYGSIGDRLWVREAWASLTVNNQIDYLYRADHHTGLEKKNGDQKWKPSIHMPRVASRLSLEIVRIRIERLRSIQEKDAIAEGCPECLTCAERSGKWGRGAIDDPLSLSAGGRPYQICAGECRGLTATEWFAALWAQINGVDSWDANPFVWVIEFKSAI